MASGIIGQLRALIGLDNSEYKSKIKETERVTTQSTSKMMVDWDRLRQGVVSFSKAPMKFTMPNVDFSSFNKELGKVPDLGGKAAKSFNGLNVQAQMLARELPALALSPQMFFLAISNNLPMLTDEIKKVADANKLLAAEGKKGIPVWRQVAGAFLNWQTVLVVGITLLVAYGKEITTFISGLFGAKKSIDDLVKSSETFNDTFASTGTRGVAAFIKLQQQWNALANDLSAKQKFIDDNKEAFRKLHEEIDTVAEAERVLSDTTGQFQKAMLDRARASAYYALAEAQVRKLVEAEEELRKLPAQVTQATYLGGSQFAQPSYQRVDNPQIARTQEQIDHLQSTINELFGIGIEADQAADDIFGVFGIKADSAAKDIESIISKALDNIRGGYTDITPVLVPIEFDTAEFDTAAYAPLADSLNFYKQAIDDVQAEINRLTGAERDAKQAQLERLQIQQALANNDYTGGLNLQSSSLEELQFLWDNADSAAQRYLATLLKISESGAVEGLKTQALEVGGIISSAVESFSSAIGEALQDGAISKDELTAMFVTPLAQAAQQFGLLLIAQGVAMQALQSGNAPAMIAGGTALVAIGSALSASLANVQNSVGGGGGTVDTFTGGYSQGSPSGVFDSTRSLDINITGKISGKDIALSLDKNNAYNRR